MLQRLLRGTAKSLFPILFFCTLVSSAFAQNTTDGAIGGTILDSAGAAVPNASITVHNNGTNADLSATANDQGYFRINQLQPGSYTVSISASGFSDFKASSVVVQVGAFTELHPVLTVGGAAQTVEVSGAAPLLHAESPEISTVLDQTAINNLPINGRRWSNFAILTPGVVSNSDGFGLLSFRGVSYLLNNVTIDGADDNQAYFSEQRGRTRAAYSTTEAAIQEFQVNTSNYSAEYGRAAGGVINTVTKSGTNNLHGQLFFYDRDNDWGAYNPYTLLAVKQPDGSYVSEHFKPKDWRKQWGFGVGGPLIKDRLFWFYAYDQSRRNFPGTAVTNDPGDVFATANPATPASCVSNSDPVQVGAACFQRALGLSTYADAANLYNSSLSIINSFLGAVPRTGDQVINFPKLDWQITNNHHFSVEYNRLRWSSPAGIQTQASNNDGIASFGNDFVKEDFGIARLNSTFSSNLLNQILFQYGRDFEYETSQLPSPNEVPLSNNSFQRPPSIQIGYDYGTGFYIGKPSFLERRAYPDERRGQLFDTLTWAHGKHTFKFGIDVNRVFDRIDNLYTENGSYSYDHVWDFMADYLHYTQGVGPANYSGEYYSYSQAFGPSAFEIATTDYAGFATDDWKLTPRFTLTLGIRYEYEAVPNALLPNNNPTYGSAPLTVRGLTRPLSQWTADTPDDKNNIGPRVGFAYDVFGKGTTILRGGYGIYFGRIINSNLLQTYLNSGNSNGQITFSNLYAPSNCGPGDPDIPGVSALGIFTSASQISDCFALRKKNPTSSIAFLDKNFQNPQIHEGDFAIEQAIGNNTAFSLSWMGSFGRQLPNGVDQNIDAASISTVSYTINNNVSPGAPPSVLPHGGKPAPLSQGFVYTTKLFTNSFRPIAGYGSIIDVVSNDNTSYNGLAAQLTHHLTHGLEVMMNYTWSHALDFNEYIGTGFPSNSQFDPTDQSKEYGNSVLDVRNRFVLAAVYQTQWQTQGWAHYLLDNWTFSPIFQEQNGLPYTLTVSGRGPGAFGGVNGSGGSSRIDIIGRNTYNYPKTTVFDARLSKRIRFADKYNLELLGEAFNVANHQNITGISTPGYSISGSASAGYAMNFLPTFGTFTNSNSNYVYSPRQVQLALRFEF